MPALQRMRMSWEAYLALPEHPRTEWVAGEVVVSPDPTWRHQRVSRRLANAFDEHLAPLYGSTSANVRLPGDRVRIPDALVTRAPAGLFVEEVPVLVVEVLSPRTRAEDTIRKSAEYAAAGIGQFWVVDPEGRSVDVYRNADGAWETLIHLDEERPAGVVDVGEHGTVPVDLVDILDG